MIRDDVFEYLESQLGPEFKKIPDSEFGVKVCRSTSNGLTQGLTKSLNEVAGTTVNSSEQSLPVSTAVATSQTNAATSHSSVTLARRQATATGGAGIKRKTSMAFSENSAKKGRQKRHCRYFFRRQAETNACRSPQGPTTNGFENDVKGAISFGDYLNILRERKSFDKHQAPAPEQQAVFIAPKPIILSPQQRRQKGFSSDDKREKFLQLMTQLSSITHLYKSCSPTDVLKAKLAGYLRQIMIRLMSNYTTISAVYKQLLSNIELTASYVIKTEDFSSFSRIAPQLSELQKEAEKLQYSDRSLYLEIIESPLINTTSQTVASPLLVKNSMRRVMLPKVTSEAKHISINTTMLNSLRSILEEKTRNEDGKLKFMLAEYLCDIIEALPKHKTRLSSRYTRLQNNINRLGFYVLMSKDFSELAHSNMINTLQELNRDAVHLQLAQPRSFPKIYEHSTVLSAIIELNVGKMTCVGPAVAVKPRGNLRYGH